MPKPGRPSRFNPNLPQRQRSQNNPLFLGKFSQTSLRLLTGSLGMRSQIIQGGYGNNTYNNWFQVQLTDEAWLILIKAGTKLKTSNVNPLQNLRSQIDSRFEFSVYDLNQTPIEGRVIIDNPLEFRGQVAATQSDLYNFPVNSKGYEINGGGDDMFFRLDPGNYLICISACMNEEFTYAVGLVIEFQTPLDEQFILTESQKLGDPFFILQESFAQTDEGSIFDIIASPIVTDKTISIQSAFTKNQALIESGVVVTVNNKNVNNQKLTWYIGPEFPVEDFEEKRILLDATVNWADTQRNRSLSEWKAAWNRENAEPFPERVFAPFVNVP